MTPRTEYLKRFRAGLPIVMTDGVEVLPEDIFMAAREDDVAGWRRVNEAGMHALQSGATICKQGRCERWADQD